MMVMVNTMQENPEDILYFLLKGFLQDLSAVEKKKVSMCVCHFSDKKHAKFSPELLHVSLEKFTQTYDLNSTVYQNNFKKVWKEGFVKGYLYNQELHELLKSLATMRIKNHLFELIES